MKTNGMMTKLVTSAHVAIFQWAKPCPSILPIGSLRPKPNEFKMTKRTPNPLIRTTVPDCDVMPLPSHEDDLYQTPIYSPLHSPPAGDPYYAPKSAQEP